MANEVIRVDRIRNGSSGSAARRSQSTNAVAAANAPAKSANAVGEAHDCPLSPRLRPSRRQAAAVPRSKAPGTSMRCFTYRS